VIERRTVKTKALTPELLRKLDAWWRAANYLSVGQIYLYGNPLLKKPLKLAHIKPRLLGHWGTTPGLNFIYAHLNRVIKERDLNAIYITGPGHGGPGLVANAYLEGTYSEVYPNIAQDADRVPHLGPKAAYAKQAIRDKLIEHKQYIAMHGEDLPEIRNWKWSQPKASV
jgi:xylulose-5-phosphate/fructose-6-phosphate phosphoketolase